MLVVTARNRPGPWVAPTAIALAVVVVGNEFGWWAWQLNHHALNLAGDLPLFPCDVAGFAAAFALWLRRQALVEMTWFWGIAGTVNGVISPDISDHFPSYVYFQYFLQHGAIPAAALFLVLGLRMYPRPWSSVRALGLVVLLLAVDALVNLWTGGNYMFLRTAPPGTNLLGLFGAWPWYIVGGTVLAVIFFAALELPFRISDLVRARSKTSPYPRSASQPSPLPPPGR
ncbi:MAG TPA: TIGR02206 family membrane protein [Candidatus Dormibacteraeota bacterium]